jgi:hypothetical protein
MGALTIDGKDQVKDCPNFSHPGDMIRFVMQTKFHYPGAMQLNDQQIKSMLAFKGKANGQMPAHYETDINYKGKKHHIAYDAGEFMHEHNA